MKVAIVYDRVNKWGGAERVLLALQEMFPEAPLFTSLYSEKNAKWAEVFPQIHTSFLQKIPFTRRRHEFLPLFMPMAFESFNFDDYDLVISVTSEAAKGILTKGKTKHLCYCLTPTRYLWSGHTDYFRNNAFRSFSKPMVEHLRRWDKIASKRPDTIIGISKEVQKRIKRYYNRESGLVYPPVDIGRRKVGDVGVIREIGEGTMKDYFLVVSRLVPYKKVDLVVETFNRLGLPLVVVGTGKEEKRLRKMAKGNIRVVGEVGEVRLGEMYKNAKAFIFPQEEDFGITAVEAQSYGIPVIAFKKGGALETVIHGKTGMFFEEQTIESLGKAIKGLRDLRFKKDDLRKNAQKFSKEKFQREFEKQVVNALRH